MDFDEIWKRKICHGYIFFVMKFFSSSRLRGGSSIFIATSTIITGGTLFVNNDDGRKRSAKFWVNIFPMYLNYRCIQLLNRDLGLMNDSTAMNIYEKLHLRYTDRVKELTYEMKGFYLKQAQMMSMQDDFVPPAYMTWLKDTQANVPPEYPGEKARMYVAEICQRELGKSFDDIFSSWDDEPLGVASIGQVHRAVLKSGEVVAVKFQNPGIEAKFRADIATLKSFSSLAMPQHVTAFEEIEKQFSTEFDYSREAENLRAAYATTMPRWSKFVRVPLPHASLCSHNLLVMEFLQGPKLVDGIKKQYGELARMSGSTLEQLENDRKAKIADGKFVFKSLEQEKWDSFNTRLLLTAHDIWQNNLRIFAYNTLNPVAWVYGPAQYQWTDMSIDLRCDFNYYYHILLVFLYSFVHLLLINLILHVYLCSRTLELLAKVQASNIFYDGIFNGDQHPGNILLLNDGRLGLIDYGQMKTMTVPERIIYAKMIIALSRDDRKEVVRLYFDEMGTLTKRRDPHAAYLLATFWSDRNTPDILGGHNIATFIDHCESLDPMVKMADRYLMACRASVLLRGMGNAFGLQLRTSLLWKDDAEKFLKSQNVSY